MSPRQALWEQVDPTPPHFWLTLGYRGLESNTERTVIEWDASADFSFDAGAEGRIIHGGLVASLLDTAMGAACFKALEDNERFLTADLRTEFYRPARPGTLRAVARVVRRTRGVAFCTADLTDSGERLIASARCTQILRSEGA
ncbi:MAG: PaaI family thioesterase [Acidimicrobiales bacterium]